MTLDLAMSDETFTALQQELDNERLTDLVVTIAFYNGLVRLLETMTERAVTKAAQRARPAA